MRYLAIACDYDGTLATDGQVDELTLTALKRLRDSGRKLIMVTGRQLEDLFGVFPHSDLFDSIVAENGAVLYQPITRSEKVLTNSAPEELLQALQERGVRPFAVGRAIVATWHPHETAVLDAIRHLGLEYQVIFNKGAVMVLPSGVNKATGLATALQELDLSPHNVVGVGDAENDHAFLRLCECAVAVQNALPMVKETADIVTPSDHGAGVIELIERLVTEDLRSLDVTLTRHYVLLGNREDGQEEHISPYGHNVLIAGSSGGGKSTLATGMLERLAEQQYQFCVIDPEGDYEILPDAVVLGTAQRVPSPEEVLQVLARPESNVVINLLGLPLEDRPQVFHALLPRLQEMRARVGRPHWIIVDEAHHLLGSTWEPTEITLPQTFMNMMFITVHPRFVAPAVLASVDTVVAMGQAPEAIFQDFTETLGQRPSVVSYPATQPGEVLVWHRYNDTTPFRLRPAPSQTDRRRHRRKYAEGELTPDRSFYFRGPDEKLNLRAQNLILFRQIADGVDDATWLYHLHRGDYSHWFSTSIKDEALAAEAKRIEALTDVSPQESRALIKAAIEHQYTLPSTSSSAGSNGGESPPER
jgi:HAD superfamily hydrolase (TIGR01484 family)